MKRTYLVLRHGSNAANQPMRLKKAIDIVEARNQKEACEIVRGSGKHTIYNNQWLSAVSQYRANREDWFDATEAWNDIV